MTVITHSSPQINELRRQAAAEIERLINILDLIDPDPDLEPSLGGDQYGNVDLEREDEYDEPTIGAPELPNQERSWSIDAGQRWDAERELDTADHEPSLGSSGSCYSADRRSQEGWATGNRDERERDDADDEPSLCGLQVEHGGDGQDLEADDSDREPSLAWPERDDQRIGVISGRSDREQDEDREPSLGSGAAREHTSQQFWGAGTGGDREDEHDGAEPDDDLEPSIGAADRIIDQRQAWQAGSLNDNELDLADLEPDDHD